MFVFEQTQAFTHWLLRLKDPQGKPRVLARIRAAQLGRFGDCEPVGEGVYEMRIHRGPGYRVYFSRRDTVIYLLLIGGDKSTQRRDIQRARQLAHDLKSEG
ncbi:type II toxin-antitoxin system RelE/ParE family toxin [Pseudomonas protegens]|uniref:type II toxin-antitoxin system RelE/ParE family toxin n=1 Tax=Pseudomonas protegens TaxID=380021 RepID=UPI000442583A|nr:type II toxin-antitoxin system RelE/ParE family toxin [Pseudomonas protegens]WRV92279.1 type II toxin-antitoxin system RelE/ParE family toxin [Pseudomonas protegens]BAO60011.1 addiction module killer protein [Pseudomonas protegens Cab57]